MNNILILKDVHKTYYDGHDPLHILKGISLNIPQGEMIGLIGQSGSGKSTLMHISGLLDNPTSGDVQIDGVSVLNISDAKRTKLRSSHMGFVFQHHFLLPELNALENVMVPLRLNKVSKKEAKERAIGLLKKVGMIDRIKHRPAQLSGGERQRIAILRAIIHHPELILADEPTGSLDEENGEIVFNLFIEMVKSHKCSLVCVTHNPALLPHFDTVYEMKGGSLNHK